MEVGRCGAGAGAGFDLTSDFRLRFAKASEGRRLVELGGETRDVPAPGGAGAMLRGVPRDVGVTRATASASAPTCSSSTRYARCIRIPFPCPAPGDASRAGTSHLPCFVRLRVFDGADGMPLQRQDSVLSFSFAKNWSVSQPIPVLRLKLNHHHQNSSRSDTSSLFLCVGAQIRFLLPHSAAVSSLRGTPPTA
ncbi:hypothetical protein HU200_013405 [Digitaria exilis]|uniref:Uncharacterized protein n=1 Tax=Digitaria exilis TaxID=1010633 RepID=A0A835FD36_9POAL|nr:hypothetical protein HU200_013405 [Digitaria exilis]